MGARPVDEKSAATAIESFHQLYYESKIWRETYWLGVEAQKSPLDLWIYQEILFELRPDAIVETGTFDGGSALFLASICDLIDHGRVITVDIEIKPYRPKHRRITYVEGLSSTSPEAIGRVKDLIQPGEKVMVILDSDHGQSHVLGELRLYGEVVTSGQYLVVEDTNINGHPVLPDFGPGPMEALDIYLRENHTFEVDPGREKFLVTFNPRGYLRKV